jgi:membrane-associated phospholipid phosphatase
LPGARLQGLGSSSAVDWAATAVYLSYFVVPHAVAVWLVWRQRDAFWRFLAATALLFLIGLICFALLPASPPWLAGDGEIRRTVHALVSGGSGASAAYAFDPNPHASMPSIHLGVTVLLAPLARGRGWRLVAALYAAAMGLALVYLGEHYVLDVVAGAMIAALASAMAMRLVALSAGRVPLAVRPLSASAPKRRLARPA